jgi:transglutaminase-like putative cysteine protease
LIRIAATGIAVFSLLLTYGGLLGRRAAVSLLTLMMCLKLLETFKVRDARVVTSLCLFLCATQFLWSQGVLMLIYGGAVLMASLISLALLQRRDAFEVKGMAPASDHSIFADLGYSSKLLVMAIPVALALFVFFPRWGSPMWGVPESTLDAKSGLSDSMSPGSIQSLFMDDSPAFRVSFPNEIPQPGEMYWRGPVFWLFDGKEWSKNVYSKNIKADLMPKDGPGTLKYSVQLEPTEQHWIFALDYPVTVPRGVTLTMDYQMYSRRSITQLISYDMISNPNFVDSPKLGNVHRSEALRLPTGFNPQTRELISQWRSETESDVELINRVLKHFNEEEFRYTLNPPLLSQHTVDEFLFETRSGFCEHYASAFTIMMRMAGIPSRVVTGYQGGYYNNIGKYVLVRQSDAHAWSEVWLPDLGWSRVDPTASVAPERIERGAMDAINSRRHIFDFDWLRSAKNGVDLLQRGWNNWFIAFDSARQRELFLPFGMGSMDTGRMVFIMISLITVIGLIMLPAILKLRLRSSADAAAKQWQIFRKKLKGAGIESHAAMTPSELTEFAAIQMQHESVHINKIANLYTIIRYAPDGPDISELESAVKDFRPARKAR